MSYQDAFDAFRQHTEPDAEAMARARLNTRHRLQHPPPRRRPPLLPAAVALTAAAAAMAVVYVQSSTAPELTTSTPPPLAMPLLSDTTQTAQLTPQVAADFHGEGHLSGSEGTPHVSWARGTLRLSVPPAQGIDLQVQTPEALVEVIGTVFTVQTDRLGTRVSVERGQVAVQCASTETRMLISTDSAAFCWPVTAARLLNRATALSDQSASAADILETVERGLNAPPTDALNTAQLRYLRIQVLGQLGRYSEAAAAARSFLADEPPMHGEAVQDYLRQLNAAGY